MLQAQDGSFYGTDGVGNMVHLSQSGNVIWSVPKDPSQIATADGGVIGASGVTYDNQGHAIGQTADPGGNGWFGNKLSATSSGVMSQADISNYGRLHASGFQ